MNHQEKFATQSSKLKVHRANSQMRSYQIRYSIDTVYNNIFFLLFFFDFFCSSLFFLTLFCFLFVCECVCECFFKQKIYILLHIQLYGWVSHKEKFTRPISGNKTTFFWPKFILCNETQMR